MNPRRLQAVTLALIASGIRWSGRTKHYCTAVNNSLLALSTCPRGGFQLCELPDDSAISLDECEIFSEAALQQHTDAKITRRICGGDQSHIFSDSPMS